MPDTSTSTNSLQKMGYENANSEIDQDLFDDVKLWCEEARHIGMTGHAIKYVMHKVAIAPEGEERELILSKIIEKSQNIWSVVVISDGLLLSILFPSLLVTEKVPIPLIPDLFDKEALDTLLLVFYALVSFTCLLAMVHMMVAIVLYAATSFIIDVEGMCWFFMRFHRHLTFINLAFFPLVYGLIISSVLSQTIIEGPYRALSTVVLGILAMIFIFLAYKWLSNRFNYLFVNVEGPWSRKSGSYSYRSKQKTVMKQRNDLSQNRVPSDLINDYMDDDEISA